MINQATTLSRRTVLRGMGVGVALPLLDAMVLHRLLAAAAPRSASPLRMGFFFVPNGVHMPDWKPKTEGADFELPSILKVLQPHKDRLLVLSGLTADKARANGDGPGDHARNVSAFLTGVQPYKTAGANIRVGVSVDQLAAQKVGHKTRFASLELGLERNRQAGSCDSGYSCAYSSSISWRSPTTPVAKEIDPRLVFERLFGSGDSNTRDENRERRERYQKSVLDFVRDDAKRLVNHLGTSDRRKMDEYLTAVRDVETRVGRAEKFDAENLPKTEKPEGVPKQFKDHARLMFDMLTLALQTDQTRICSFMMGNAGSNRHYREIEISDGHHSLSHHGNDEEKLAKISKINHFHMDQFAYFIDRLASIEEGDGTLLDHVMLVYGSGIGDGNRHNHDDLPILLVGGGNGTIKPGRHIKYADETPLNNLYLGLLERMGVPAISHGDSTAKIGRLDG